MNLKYINSCNDDLVVKLRGEMDAGNLSKYVRITASMRGAICRLIIITPNPANPGIFNDIPVWNYSAIPH